MALTSEIEKTVKKLYAVEFYKNARSYSVNLDF